MKALLLALTFALSAPAFAEISMGQKIQLQADMQRHIDSVSIGGVYRHIDISDGSVRALYPAAGHPMILKMTQQDMFVLCSEMRDDQGASLNVDYYMAKTDTGFQVIRTEIAN
ncbi:MAG: hypothetical protein ACPGUF_08595, partial [Litorivicinus sp.]